MSQDVPSYEPTLAEPQLAALARVAAIAFLRFSGALLGFTLLWGLIYGSRLVPAELLPSPLAVGRLMVEHADVMLRDTRDTGYVALLGFLIAGSVAGAAILVAALWRPLVPVVTTGAVFTQTVPIVAIAPVILFTLGFTLTARVTIAALIAFFPLVSSAIHALQYPPLELHCQTEALALRWYQRLWWLDAPRLLEPLVANAKVGAVLSVIGAIIAELVSPVSGIGRMIEMSRRSFNEVPLYAGVVLATGLGLSFYAGGSTLYLAYRLRRRDLHLARV